MVKFIGKRLAYAVLTLFLITTATFFLVAGAPGDPIAAKVGQMPKYSFGTRPDNVRPSPRS